MKAHRHFKRQHFLFYGRRKGSVVFRHESGKYSPGNNTKWKLLEKSAKWR